MLVKYESIVSGTEHTHGHDYYFILMIISCLLLQKFYELLEKNASVSVFEINSIKDHIYSVKYYKHSGFMYMVLWIIYMYINMHHKWQTSSQ